MKEKHSNMYLGGQLMYVCIRVCNKSEVIQLDGRFAVKVDGIYEIRPHDETKVRAVSYTHLDVYKRQIYCTL